MIARQIPPPDNDYLTGAGVQGQGKFKCFAIGAAVLKNPRGIAGKIYSFTRWSFDAAKDDRHIRKERLPVCQDKVNGGFKNRDNQIRF
jgi:hypothetical protein